MDRSHGPDTTTGDSGDEAADRQRRRARLAAYDALRELHPALFVNPPGGAIEILLDRADQERVAREVTELAVASGLPEEWGDIGVVYRDPYVSVVRDAVRFPSGRTGTYIRMVSAADVPGAAVLPVLSDGRLVLLRHFRHAERGWHWEIPRGFGSPGEDGAATARRELREEAGCEASDLTHLGTMSPDTGLRAGRDHLYLARVDTAGFRAHAGPEAREEGIGECRALTLGEFEDMLVTGRISDAYTLAAYGLARARGLLGEGGS
ncbi:NUDIX domain-containing protein [Streptomyces sp. YS-3]|uniref:NUDIX hydrolase n=1 Tax=Streptomyces sp. YS-3 TaxID=3381352 RepID=UPI003862227C